MARLTITLKTNEKKALFRLADREYRDPRHQAALIIRTELEKKGILNEIKAEKPRNGNGSIDNS